MAFWGKSRKQDLFRMGSELGASVTPEMKIMDIRKAVLACPDYEEEFAKDLLMTFISERKENEIEEENQRKNQEEKEKEKREEEREKREEERQIREFELERLRLQNESQGRGNDTEARPERFSSKIDLQKILPRFNVNEDDISMFLLLFERQMKVLKVPEEMWVSHLIGTVPRELTQLIAREPEEKSQDYRHMRCILLQRFKLSADNFRKLFTQHRKSPDSTWKDYYFEIRNYFEGWIAELKVSEFKQLCDLIITDQMKKRVSTDCKEHLLDEWEGIICPKELAEKLDAYDNIRNIPSKPPKKPLNKPREEPSGKTNSYRKEYNFPRGEKPSYSHIEKPSLSCYGCGKPGFVRAKCPNCSVLKKEDARLNSIQLYTCIESSAKLPMVDVTIFDAKATVCADTGATRTVGGELLYHFLVKRGQKFKGLELTLTLADGQEKNEQVQECRVPIRVKGLTVLASLIFLPNAKGNRTLLGMDFLEKAGIVLDPRKRCWFFGNNPRYTFPFAKEGPLPDNPDRKIDLNMCFLREDEGKSLIVPQKEKLNSLLGNFEKVFQPGGEPTPFTEHRINTGTHPPVAGPPYRMSPAKQEVLKKEVDELLKAGIIEECESPYAAPVVLIPKANGSVRLCIDYRKLNACTVPDTYPLPRMDDLLQGAHHTSFMSTIDLKSGYHQVSVHPPDRDKTAFVCPFGTFRYTRMAFGLRNAPATFQRLMDRFCRGLPALTYLDDIIVLSPTFEKHIEDLETVFKRLIEFKLHANRSKCHFACSRVKYLGLWITPHGIEVDPDKVSAILGIPPPQNVKQLQSFLQTCSWFRKFILNFSEIAQPLSNLTKKNTVWSWEEKERNAFDSLKQSLVSPPVLKQADFSQPFVIRTDASNYALGACLLQGQGAAEERPIEYASRLLSAAERNYSTTEREALAVVWALNKFRGYIEGTSVTVASDHQPLRWLLSLKSPSGRLARWALQIQSYNLNIEYTPGRSNVVADMLSRPRCQHEAPSCEVCTITIDIPSRSPNEIRIEQLKDEGVAKIVKCFESEEKDVDYANWTERGFLMNQGVLFRYSPDSESEEAQLVVPAHERDIVLKDHHDAPTAGHYGAEGTFERIAKRYYWTGMRKFITEYVKSCPDCNRFKVSNQKPAGLLQTPVPSQRFETIAIDLFGPLPETKDGKRWIFIIEDCATKWVELFALPNATARECSITLLEEVLLRYGLPRRIISDNGTQFVSAVMQQLCFLLNIKQSLIPVYHPQANPVERKNRDLKPRLAILVHSEHTSWSEKLPTIRFALNTAKCQSTGQTASYLHFGRELRTIDDVTNDIRGVIENDNFVPEITPYLEKFAKFMTQVKEVIEEQQDKNKFYADKKRRPAPHFAPGDRVYVTMHPVSSAAKGKCAKFMPRRDGPYVILTQRSPSSYEIASLEKPQEPLGVYHSSALKHCQDSVETPMTPLRKRGRPPKGKAGCLSGRRHNQRGRM